MTDQAAAPRPRRSPPTSLWVQAFEQRFINDYLRNGFNATEAYLSLGRTKNRNSAGHLGSIMRRRPWVDAEIRKRLSYQSKRAALTVDKVVARLHDIIDADLTKYKKVDAAGLPYWDFTDADPKDFAAIATLQVSEYYEGRGDDKRTVKEFKIKEHDVISLARLALQHLGELEASNSKAGNEPANKGTSEPNVVVINGGSPEIPVAGVASDVNDDGQPAAEASGSGSGIPGAPDEPLLGGEGGSALG